MIQLGACAYGRSTSPDAVRTLILSAWMAMILPVVPSVSPMPSRLPSVRIVSNGLLADRTPRGDGGGQRVTNCVSRLMRIAVLLAEVILDRQTSVPAAADRGSPRP